MAAAKIVEWADFRQQDLEPGNELLVQLEPLPRAGRIPPGAIRINIGKGSDFRRDADLHTRGTHASATSLDQPGHER